MLFVFNFLPDIVGVLCDKHNKLMSLKGYMRND